MGSLDTLVEQSLRDLVAVPPGRVSDGGACATTWPRTVRLPYTLNWGTLPLAAEGTLPTAVVTWPGHARVAAEPVATTIAAGHADTAAERGHEAESRVGVAVGGRGTRTAPGAVADVCTLPVGGDLVDAMAGLDVAAVDDVELLDVAGRWQEVISWAIAVQSRALGEIGRRRGWTDEHTAAAAEISARLRVPQGEANKHLARGAGLAEHPPVLQALQHGEIDVAKADILLRSGNPLTVEEREQAIARFLPEAPERTRRWLRDKMNGFAAELKGSKETVKHARSRRAVFLDPSENSMAWLSANLPATDAAAVWDAVEQAAHALRRAPGGTRTLAQARADALVAIATGRIIVPPRPECTPEPAGTGLPDADPAAATSRPATSDVETADGTATTSEARTTTGATTPSASGADEPALPRTTVPATGCTCGGCTCGGIAIRVVPVKPQIRITIPATTLLGLDDTPGDLDGYGPIPADLAAQIATDATWQRLLTDPVTGILTDYSTATYQPGKVLRQAVVARDQTCTFVHCDHPARFADLDHIHPFDHELDPTTRPPGAPGQTRARNLQPLCRAHHLAKTHHGWTPVRDPDTGVTTWTAPTGHVYARPPGITGHVSNDITSLTEDTRARLGQPPLNGPLESYPTADGTTERPTTERPTTERPTAEQPTTEQQLRRFPDEPPF